MCARLLSKWRKRGSNRGRREGAQAGGRSSPPCRAIYSRARRPSQSVSSWSARSRDRCRVAVAWRESEGRELGIGLTGTSCRNRFLGHRPLCCRIPRSITRSARLNFRSDCGTGCHASRPLDLATAAMLTCVLSLTLVVFSPLHSSRGQPSSRPATCPPSYSPCASRMTCKTMPAPYLDGQALAREESSPMRHSRSKYVPPTVLASQPHFGICSAS